MGDGAYLVDASIDIDDLNDLLGSDLPTEDSDTLGGLIYEQLGRVPTPGETVDLQAGVTAQVHSLEGRRIRKVTVTYVRPSDDDDDKPKPAKPDGDAELEPETD
jgi:CBS domain containing-hemolysin-like protein